MLAVAACQSPTAPPPARVELDAAGRAAAALEAGRYAEAVGLFREALAPAPANVALRCMGSRWRFRTRTAELPFASSSGSWRAPRVIRRNSVESQAWLAPSRSLAGISPPPATRRARAPGGYCRAAWPCDLR